MCLYMFVSGVRVQLVQAGQRLDSESQHEVPRARSALLKSVVSYRAPTMTLPVQVTGSNHDPSLGPPRVLRLQSRPTRITDRPGLRPPQRGWSQLLLLKLIDRITISLYLLLHLSLGHYGWGIFTLVHLFFAVTLRLLKL